MTSKSGIPYTEYYRPKSFDTIVLDELNRQILTNIIEMSYFPNLLFYGPPGTGKTTTIINVINAYQQKNNQCNSNLIIHLNASDERGIDTIRNQINMFVNSNPMFNDGMKFIILDEVDYMTKTAQQALRYLLQNYVGQVRFCLICNYISRIEEGLQNEFIKLHFNQLPKQDIIEFLRTISNSEQLNLTTNDLENIQQKYKSDIRSMINFMQSNQQHMQSSVPCKIIDNTIWDTLYKKLSSNSINSNREITPIIKYITNISTHYNIDKKNMIKDFCNYLIRTYPHSINSALCNVIEQILHSPCQNTQILVSYFIIKVSSLLANTTTTTTITTTQS